MNRTEYINTLRNGLMGLPENEIMDILYDYEEHFEIGLSKGKSEEEIARELGDPRNIAKSYKVSSTISEAKNNPSPKNLIKAILAAMALGIFNLIIVLGPFLLVIGLLFGLYAVSISFIVAGIGSFFGTIVAPFFPYTISIGFYPITAISFGIGLIALGLLMGIGCFYLTKLLYQGIIKYLRWNIDIINK
ncbi:hypothetical protein TXYLGN1_15470 [Tepidimicrobium xylanilyticum]|uniref:Uncharacterized membrane protein n=1 Tax=Tepidimicrobium xylanilyticum TaxID=1123352 RepID=A0A1H2Z7C2_9FIRM|nr:hypothetical protein EN5CB1_12200 [Tepidimicrobium xylanilyticum]SDX12888.1 Uncharacterized membrane protein [Tepidimicrobium xylanilyticum]